MISIMFLAVMLDRPPWRCATWRCGAGDPAGVAGEPVRSGLPDVVCRVVALVSPTSGCAGRTQERSRITMRGAVRDTLLVFWRHRRLDADRHLAVAPFGISTSTTFPVKSG